MIDIIDAHHHIWRQRDLPWLNGPMQPRIFGPYEPIMRDYPMSEFLRDSAGQGVVKSVYVQANWLPEAFEHEAAWVQSVAQDTGWPHGIVAFADFTVEDVRPQLDALARYPLLRGLRQQFHWHANARYRFASRPDLPLDPTVQRNVARLADYKWSFDLQVFAGQMVGAAELAAACPDVTFVLQHAGMLEDTTPPGWNRWRAGMRLLAEQPNVVSKTSALGTFLHRVDSDHIEAVVLETVAMFGPKRCLFGSNYPIEKLWTGYGELISAHRRAVGRLSRDAQHDILRRTAARVYRL